LIENGLGNEFLSQPTLIFPCKWQVVYPFKKQIKKKA
jgi:hypothetical protein